MTRCDHSALTTPFCASCGKRVGVAREPGEIRAMRERIKTAKPKPGKGDGMTGLIFVILLDLAFSWALGETDDAALLKIVEGPDAA